MQLLIWLPVWHPIDFIYKDGREYTLYLCSECEYSCETLKREGEKLLDVCHMYELKNDK